VSDVLVLTLVLWAVYVSDSVWWTTERSLILIGRDVGRFTFQHGPSIPLREGKGLFVPRLAPPFASSFELLLNASETAARRESGREIRKHVERVLDYAAPLHLLGAGLWTYLLVLGPATAWTFGLSRTWIWLLLILAGWMAAIVLTYRRQWRALYPERAREWRSTAALMCLSPPGAIRAGDRFTRSACQTIGWIDATRALVSADEFGRLARMMCLDCNRGPRARSEFELAVGRDHLAKLLSIEPATEPGMKGYCPRCHGQVLRSTGQCPDCIDVVIRPFTTAT
jgi:hypothetical protein